MNANSIETRGKTEADIILEAEDALYFELLRVLERYVQPQGCGTLTEDEVRDIFDNVMARLV